MMTWRERLARAKQWDEFTDDDREAAGGWSTCYVGEHHAGNLPILPKAEDVGGVGILHRGLKFYDAVDDNNVPEAIRIADALDALWAGERP